MGPCGASFPSMNISISSAPGVSATRPPSGCEAETAITRSTRKLRTSGSSMMSASRSRTSRTSAKRERMARKRWCSRRACSRSMMSS